MTYLGIQVIPLMTNLWQRRLPLVGIAILWKSHIPKRTFIIPSLIKISASLSESFFSDISTTHMSNVRILWTKVDNNYGRRREQIHHYHHHIIVMWLHKTLQQFYLMNIIQHVWKPAIIAAYCMQLMPVIAHETTS